MPRTEYAAFSGLPPTSTAFNDFRPHEPRIKIDGLSASPGRLVARVSASVATTEGCTGRGSISPAADTVFASVFAIPIDGGTGSADTLAAATPIAQPTYVSRSPLQETAPPRPPVRLCPSPPFLALQPHRRRRRADEQRQQQVMHSRCRLGFGLDGAPRPSSRRSTTPSRVPRPRPTPSTAATPALADSPVRTVPLPSDRDHAKSIWELLSFSSRLLLETRRLYTRSDALGNAAELRFADSVTPY